MHVYRAVGNRCAVDFTRLQLPISDKEALMILTHKGFDVIRINILALARSCVGRSFYRRGAQSHEAPAVVDCSSFTQWLYGLRGIELPRRSIQQYALGRRVMPRNAYANDLVFTSGRRNFYFNDPKWGIGHVGILTAQRTVIHAANEKCGVVESPLSSWVKSEAFRGIKRIIPSDHKIITLATPPRRDVRTSDDIRWIILESL